jgi:hypothetical protein
MNRFARFPKVLLASPLALAAALSLSACDPGYTYYSVYVTSSSGTSAKENPPTRGTDRDYIENCSMTICTSTPCKSEDGVDNKVLEKFPLSIVAGSPGQKNQQGCSGGLTPQKVGYFHYSSARSSKDLYFTVEAFDSGSNTGDNGKAQVIQTATSSPPYNNNGQPELQVSLPMAVVAP